ncbi:MAG: FtsK/SpoIIIE domain-containing protein [Lacisediminihabitans sp.]
MIAQRRQAEFGSVEPHSTARALALPRRPALPPARSFPVVATAAPVVGSLALWAVTQSPYVLVFALLGPIVAIASLGDAAMQGRTTLRRERRRFAAEVAALREAIDVGHARERARRVAVHRDARSLIAAPHRDAERWRGGLGRELLVVVGTGCLTSTLALEDTEGSAFSPAPDEYAEALDSLRVSAATLRAAPVVVDARLGLGIYGNAVLASAVARGIILQLATHLSPRDYELVTAHDGGNHWLAGLPHTLVLAGSLAGTVVFRRRARSVVQASIKTSETSGQRVSDTVTIAVAESAASLPRECRVLLRVEGATSCEIIPAPVEAVESAVVPEFISREQSGRFAAVLAGAAEAAGLLDGADALPGSVDFASLCGTDQEDQGSGRADAGPRDSLACTPVQSVTGPLALDLVRDGPHAIVGGTTGSGKSEFLVAWILAMAARFGPQRVTFLLVDFKGGSSFHAVQQLPHSVGLITDLDEHSARRALTSLRAELRYRERALAEAGARSIEQLAPEHPLARLVIVVDEFAAMVQDFPDLHELFADIAARGRSLGVHLILCTQRPSGVVRDAVLANCTLRVSLRVNNASDSTALLGTSAAAELPRLPVGRALVSLGGEAARAVQVALTHDSDVRTVDQRWRSQATDAGVQPRRPWCDPLPALIRLSELPGLSDEDGLVFGVVDRPSEQCTAPARYDPNRDGSLLVIGAHRSGKSGALTALHCARAASADDRGTAVLVPADHEGAWDIVTDQLAKVRSGSSKPCLLMIDDLDALLGSLLEEYSFAFADAVTALLREGGRAGTHLVISAARLGSSLQSIAALCDSRLLLRLPDKHEHVAAGGEAAAFTAELTAGGGHWRGDRVQVALAPPTGLIGRDTVGGTMVCPEWEGWPGWAVVTNRPAELARRLGEDQAKHALAIGLPRGWEIVTLDSRPAVDLSVVTPSRGAVLIADAETWQSHWALLATVRTTMPIVFDGCGAADFRALTRQRELPPLIAAASASVWMLTPGGGLERSLPPWAGARARS